MPEYKPRHDPPDPEAWDRFVDTFTRAAGRLDLNLPSPDPRWTDEQYAMGLAWAAVERLTIDLNTSEAVREVTIRWSEAWEYLRRGVTDPLFEPKTRLPGPKPHISTVWYRAHLLRLLDEVAGADAAKWATVADQIADAVKAAKPPEGYVVSGKTVLNWRDSARHPSGPADEFLSELYSWIRPLPVPPRAGPTIEDRVGWIVDRLRDRLRRGR